TVRKSVSAASISSPHADPPVPNKPSELPSRKLSVKSKTCQDLGSHSSPIPQSSPLMSEHAVEDVSFFLSGDSDPSMYDDLSSLAIPPPVVEKESELERPREFPLGFEPLRSEQLAEMTVQSSPVVKDPFCSPLLAPDSMLKGLPPVHIVACALDPMLDDSVMFAKRLRSVEQPVTLCIVDDLPHGFLSLSQLSKETREAANVCVERIRAVFNQKDTPPEPRKHRKLERTDRGELPPSRETGALLAGPRENAEAAVGKGAKMSDGEGSVAVAAQNNSDAGGIGA
ncbi:hypothetical protein CHARACLAT_023169, partial [Characodon lateralis]|nr:hypothetical protein [Characodon lateralis]